MDLRPLRRLLEDDTELARDPGGRFAPSRGELLASRIFVVLASAWFAAAASWELLGPILGGHYASVASMGIIADNIHRWGIKGPVWVYTAAHPDASMYYCHHPWGIFWTTAGFRELFGRHDYVCRLPAVLLSALTPPVLYAIGRDLYRPIAGASAACAFVVLPITLSFANFNALEVPVMAFGAMFLWGWIRFRRSRQRRWMAFSLVSALAALNSDWPAFVLVFAVLVVELGSMAAAPRIERRRVLYWALLAACAVTVGALYLVLFARLGQLDDLFASYELRADGRSSSIAADLRGRRYWIELSFTPLAIALGKCGVLVLAARVILLRRAEELAALCVLAMALLQYLVFSQGAEVHVFWPHYFALYFALAMAALTATIAPSISRLAATRRWRGWPASLAVSLLPLLLVLRDGVEVLAWARATGGRFNEKGGFIQTDGDKVFVLRQIALELPQDASVGLDQSMGPTWAQIWSLGGRVVETPASIPQFEPLANAVLIADLRNLSEVDATFLLHGYEVRALGPYLVAREGYGFSAYSVRAREPTLAEWLLTSATEPQRSLQLDPFATWEIAVHHAVVAPYPQADPRSLEDLRIAHNVAVDRADPAAAERLMAELARHYAGVSARFTDGTALVGFRVTAGVQPRVALLLRAEGPLSAGVVPKIRSRVVESPWLSTTMADPTRRDVAARPLIAPRLWRRGWLYLLDAPLLPRPGIEAFELSFAGAGAPRPSTGAAAAHLFRY